MHGPGPTPIAATETSSRITRAAALMVDCGPEFARTARRFSARPEDADDALGRAVEILLRKAPDLEPAALAAWMRTVTRREALGLSRSRRRADERRLPLEPEFVRSPAPDPSEELERRERLAAAAERLSRLKPQERRALALQAAGCSYAEIQAITGWTYTKVNRCLAEGRAALREPGEAAGAGEGRTRIPGGGSLDACMARTRLSSVSGSERADG